MTRHLEVLIVPALVLAAIAVPIPLMADRLPDPIATHWGIDGAPDGSLDPTVLGSPSRASGSRCGCSSAYGR